MARRGATVRQTLASLRHRSETLALLVIWLGAAWLYFWWVGWPRPRWSTADPGGYSSALADAFLAGQLHLKQTPAPELQRLADPYDPTQYGPYQVMDLSYYRGRYYSYFGIAPVVLLFLPWQAITGSHLTEQFGAAFFACAALAVALVLLARARRRYFRDAAGWLVGVGGVVLAFGNFSLMLLEPPYYPQVEMASAWFWQITALLCAYQALHSVRRTAGWIAGISLACGLAVASRPSYLLGALLLLPILWAAMMARAPASPPAFRCWPRIIAAGLGPIAAVGVGLMLYNYARFGSPFEFGMRYQQWGRDLRSQVFLSPANLWPNLKAYFFGAPRLVRYFPFFLHQTEPVGALLFFPFCWLAALVPVGLACRSALEERKAANFLLACAIAFAGNLVLLAHYYLAWARYQLDFQPQLTWLAVLGLLAAGHAWRQCVWKRRFLGGAAVVLAAANLLTSFCYPSAAPYQSPAKTAGLARLLDRPAAWVDHLRGAAFGPLHLEVEFPSGRAGHTEPLLSTGTTLKDLLYVRYVDDTHVQIGLFHEGLGGSLSDPVDLAGRPQHTLDIGWGALCPPAQHPVFAGWTAAAVTRAHTNFSVQLDGRDLFAQDAIYHISTPGDMLVGETPNSFGFCDPVFTGRIIRTRPLPLQPPPARAAARHGVILDLQFGHRRVGYAEPLLAAGGPRAFDLVFAKYLPGDLVQFGIDDSAAGAIYADPVRLPDTPAAHRLAVWLQAPATGEAGAARGARPALRRQVLIFCDDHPVLQRELDSAPTLASASYFGVNPLGSSSAEPMFAGRILAVRSTGPAFNSGRETVLPGGPIRLVASFPSQNVGRSEPLVVTGITGAGDLVYVRYLDDRRIQFGFDHWGVGGIVGQPVDPGPAGFHQIEVSLGSLYPPAHDAGRAGDPRRRRVAVTLDGGSVLAGESPCHPATPRQVYVGENPIGGSTCGERFTGRLLLVERGANSPP
jgi:hypothetical protein